MSPTVDAPMIEAASKGISRLTRPSALPGLLTLACVAGFGIMLYWSHQERAALLLSLDRNTVAVDALTKAVQAHELSATSRSDRDRLTELLQRLPRQQESIPVQSSGFGR